jgi:hypothetical protein
MLSGHYLLFKYVTTLLENKMVHWHIEDFNSGVFLNPNYETLCCGIYRLRNQYAGITKCFLNNNFLQKTSSRT